MGASFVSDEGGPAAGVCEPMPSPTPIRAATAALLLLVAVPAFAQNVVNDLLGGDLVDPKAGQWLWYELRDAQGDKQVALRQAVVEEEKVGRKKGYWVEFQVVPEVGYETVYKVLLTGPASDPDNIHKVLYKRGLQPVQELAPGDDDDGDAPRPKRKSHGAEDVLTGSGVMRAEHIAITQGDDTIHLWVNDDVKPSGIVKLRTAEGEMVLRSQGFGGYYAESALERANAPGEFKVEAGPGEGEPEEEKAE